MSCPNCGLQTLPDQKFCRVCGASLRVTTQPLPERTTLSERERALAIGPQNDRSRANNLTFAGLVIMFLGVALGVIGKKLAYLDVVTVAGVLISLVGMFLTLYPYLAPSRRKPGSPTTAEAEQVSQAEGTNALAEKGTIEYMPSITERTTNLLNNPPTRSKPNEDGKSHA